MTAPSTSSFNEAPSVVSFAQQLLPIAGTSADANLEHRKFLEQLHYIQSSKLAPVGDDVDLLGTFSCTWHKRRQPELQFISALDARRADGKHWGVKVAIEVTDRGVSIGCNTSFLAVVKVEDVTGLIKTSSIAERLLILNDQPQLILIDDVRDLTKLAITIEPSAATNDELTQASALMKQKETANKAAALAVHQRTIDHRLTELSAKVDAIDIVDDFKEHRQIAAEVQQEVAHAAAAVADFREDLHGVEAHQHRIEQLSAYHGDALIDLRRAHADSEGKISSLKAELGAHELMRKADQEQLTKLAVENRRLDDCVKKLQGEADEQGRRIAQMLALVEGQGAALRRHKLLIFILLTGFVLILALIFV